MTKKSYVVAYYDYDGDPWALLVDGHVDIRAVAEELRDKARIEGIDVPDMTIAWHWIRDAEGEGDIDPDYSMRWCDADAPGATPVTGVRF